MVEERCLKHKFSSGRDKDWEKNLPVPIEGMKKHERIEDLVYEHHTNPFLFCG